MTLPGAWHVVRHVVRVCGRVADDRGAALGGVAVTLWSVPEEGIRPARGRNARPVESAVCALRDQTETRADGLFYFVDCPSGNYIARALASRAGAPVVCGVAGFRLAALAEGKAEPAAAEITVSRVAAHLTDSRT